MESYKSWIENYTTLIYTLNTIPIKTPKGDFCKTEKIIINSKKFKYINCECIYGEYEERKYK